MDGRFAPAFGFGERLVEHLVADGGLPVDVHQRAAPLLDQPYPLRRRLDQFRNSACRSARLAVRRRRIKRNI
jgi:hypothetical protein